ncbi:3-isopropylmalate dehydratase small subunit 2-related [Anaeramoeba ignava]|uniref:3-isopropylmalate dehydratase small subunit 2-related n=1 Tax=Anaeramoeba ignava TaxID=1746090 RepID=A0A9Q0R9Q1_ANAIG|nr:3-isopropylmalate dehydratase small subunit 2-related [Anaeramoeba ignava]
MENKEQTSDINIWYYPDSNINTDMLFPGKYTYTCSTVQEIRPHLLEDLDSTFTVNVKPGDIMFVGKNFGCGSSREQPALGLRSVGIQAIIGKGFARIFYRASINQGLILVECPEAVDEYKKGAKVSLDLENGIVTVSEKKFTFPKIPDEILRIRDAGGLLPYTRQILEKQKQEKQKQEKEQKEKEQKDKEQKDNQKKKDNQKEKEKKDNQKDEKEKKTESKHQLTKDRFSLKPKNQKNN